MHDQRGREFATGARVIETRLLCGERRTLGVGAREPPYLVGYPAIARNDEQFISMRRVIAKYFHARHAVVMCHHEGNRTMAETAALFLFPCSRMPKSAPSRPTTRSQAREAARAANPIAEPAAASSGIAHRIRLNITRWNGTVRTLECDATATMRDIGTQLQALGEVWKPGCPIAFACRAMKPADQIGAVVGEGTAEATLHAIM